MAYDTFETFHRSSDMNIINYINECAVLDSGLTQNVCGLSWVNSYL